METSERTIAWTGGIKRVMSREPAMNNPEKDYN
jgi:hypothetical protein